MNKKTKKCGRIPLPFGDREYKNIAIRMRQDMYDFLRDRALKNDGAIGREAKKIIRMEMIEHPGVI
jgi:hypothetical protein